MADQLEKLAKKSTCSIEAEKVQKIVVRLDHDDAEWLLVQTTEDEIVRLKLSHFIKIWVIRSRVQGTLNENLLSFSVTYANEKSFLEKSNSIKGSINLPIYFRE